ncbi:hypothetical protein [Streptomyces tropicalis]|uniref:Uncharacterized protein n=1 Tax=Streptomyces tropicalis TaxID=3034234 RepID=A0ABT6A7V7_9ACTN|nr:hypothetical protein [Streptomyces tropicalis]MDF3300737.1 hypothetical protein [Streptomyces tropicalis]
MNPFAEREKPERDSALPKATEPARSEHGGDSSRREIARQIALEGLRADRHVLETSAATAYRDFSYAHPA